MKIFFIGIAGAGMASLARYALEQGNEVFGSDPYASAQARAYWTDRGCRIYSEHHAQNIEGADMVVYSSAIPVGNVERMAASARGIAVSRGEALARFANAHGGSIAVCGTHGKGTTSGAVAHIFATAGIAASDILGAVPRGRLSSSRYVENARYLVCEVDESDRTHRFHRPKVLLLNNVEVDHLNTYRDLDDIVDAFADHIRACVASTVIVHYAGVGAPKLYARLSDLNRVIWIAHADEACQAQWRYRYVSCDDEQRYTVELRNGETAIQLDCGLCGRANAQNLVSAAVTALTLGVDAAYVVAACRTYAGLCDRCEVTRNGRRALVTDYASHPTCVENDIAWNRTQCHRILAVYHPYRYSLMAYHWDGLARALSRADVVFIAPFDGAGEPPVEGMDSEDLARRIRAYVPTCRAMAFDSFDALEKAAKTILTDDDRLIIFGGGPLFTMGHRILGS